MSIKISIDDAAIVNKIDRLCKDKETMLLVHNELARYCDPYVPMQSGILATAKEVTADGVRYTSPYAHYQYTGIVYGPNIPIMRDGMIVGWFSRPNEPKTPTDKHIVYSTEMHPLASARWDEAMMRDRGDEFKQQIVDILKYKASKI